MRCPACLGRTFRLSVRAEEIARQVRARERFVEARLAAGEAVLPDRIRFVQNDIVDLYSCGACGTLRRDTTAEETPHRYAEDRYATAEMERMLAAYIEDYRCREPHYRPLLDRGADVLEIGSYVGGFLHAARDWGWNAVGVDIGTDVSSFANSRGLRTVNLPVESCGFAARSFDAVFVWNCFEQVPDPDSLLSEVGRVLRPQGPVVIRTPNAAFYTLYTGLLAFSRNGQNRFVRALEHHNLLGFPFLYGYRPAALDKPMARHGFTRAGAVRPRGILPQRWAPWLEVTYRRGRAATRA